VRKTAAPRPNAHPQNLSRRKGRNPDYVAPDAHFSRLLREMGISAGRAKLRVYRDPAGILVCSNPVALGRPSTKRIVSKIVWMTDSFPTAVLIMMW
jgi:hypothetical protein